VGAEQLDRRQKREALVAAGLVDEGVGEPALREEVELRATAAGDWWWWWGVRMALDSSETAALTQTGTQV
jgi:hypothetical protein